jgi:hypothetical protein
LREARFGSPLGPLNLNRKGSSLPLQSEKNG